MRRSRNDAAETRERILATASEMFLKKGLACVGMRDIMSAASMTQGGFYRHFDSKEQLIAEASSRAFDRLFEMLESETAAKSPAEAISHIVSLYLNQTQGGNAKASEAPFLCPLSMLGAELSHADPKVRAIAIAGYERLVRLLATPLRSLGAPSALTVARGVVSTMVGAVTLAAIAPDKKASKLILSTAQTAIEAQLRLKPIPAVSSRRR